MNSGRRIALATRINESVFYGWIMVALAGLGIFASGPGQSHTFSVFVGPISEDLGISQTGIASAYAFATLGAAFLLPVMGRQVDRYGPRMSLLGVTICLGLACLLFGAAAGFLWLAIGFAMLRFFGQGSMMLGCANLVSHWFSARRGTALSLMALGFGLSMAVHPNLGLYLIEAYGWRQAWVALGVMTWLMMLPPIIVLMQDHPEDLGLAPDNAEVTSEAKPALMGLTLGEALKHPAFYLVAGGMSSLSMLVTALHYHQFNIFTLNGLEAEWAGRAFTISALTMVALMPLVGQALDRFPTRYVFAAGLTVQATALIMITFAASVPMLILYAVIFGLNNAFTMTMFGYLWPRYFGRLHLGKIQGTGQMIAVVGASIGPLPIGYAIDTTGDPVTMIRMLAILPVVMGVLVVLFLRTPKGVK